MPIRLFVYGSLLPGLANHHWIAGRTLGETPGCVQGRLVDCGAYPALVRDQEANRAEHRVQGLWIEVGQDVLASLDKLEEFYGPEEYNDYERIWTRDALAADVSGWVYVWPADRGMPAVTGDSWPVYLHRRQHE